jgi:hypothetical protein
MRIVLGVPAVAALLPSLAARAVSGARARGEFGPPDSLGRNGQCTEVDGRSIGVFFDADSPYVAVRRFAAVDLASHTRRTAPLDIEVWLIPASLIMGPAFTLGGEHGFLFTPDGRTLVRQSDAFADYRPFVIPDTGTVRIVSRSATRATLPSLSEMVLPNGLNDAGRDVAVQWGGITSVLTGRGERAVWAQIVPTP